jgi:hypothetical protein
MSAPGSVELFASLFRFRAACLELERISIVAVTEVKPKISCEEADSSEAFPLLDVGLLVAEHGFVEVALAGENVRGEGNGEIPPGEEQPSDPRAVVDLHLKSPVRRRARLSFQVPFYRFRS